MNSKAPSWQQAGSGNQNGAKKMVIKPFKTQPKIPENYEQSTWEKLAVAVRAVNSKVAVSISKEELYRAVEDLCLHKFGGMIYENLSKECEAHIYKEVDSLLDQIHLVDCLSYLTQVDIVWAMHCENMVTVRNIFLYLDRSYALQTPGVKSLWDLGLEIFRRRLEMRKEVESKLIVSLLGAVEMERQGFSIDRGVMQRLLNMLVSIDLYHPKFESHFIADSRRFFVAEGQALIQNFAADSDSTTNGTPRGVANLRDPGSYFAHVERRLQEAMEMLQRYLDCSSKTNLLLSIEGGLLIPHIPLLVEKGLGPLLDATANATLISTSIGSKSNGSSSGGGGGGGGGGVSNLKRMFHLMDRVGATESLKIGWGLYIRRVGESMTVVSDPAQEKAMIENLLAFQERLEIVLNAAFNNHEGFRYSMKSAFEHFLNLQQSKPAKLLADYVDRKMRGERGLGDSELDTVMEKVISLFRFLQAKDIFERFYKNKLSKRLLLGKSASDDLEKSMLSKLKTECGSNFTSKLEGMFQDVELSRDAMTAFTVYSQQLLGPPISSPSSSSLSITAHKLEPECYVQLLTAGYWPASPSVETLNLPLELVTLQDRYNTFYCSKYQGRRLQWAHAHQRCVLTARFPKGKKELEVSLFQAIVLLVFNRSDSLVYTTIRSLTGVEDGELRRTLQSLAGGPIGTRVLIKSPKGKEVEDADSFSYNSDFSNKLYRIKFNSIQLRETEEEIQKTHEEVFRDRQYQADAVIVRTMKSRKRLSHTMLMGELMTQLRFPATSADLKKRIESLIEREYLERDPEDGTFYRYLA